MREERTLNGRKHCESSWKIVSGEMLKRKILGTYVLVHVTRDVGHVEVRVGLVGELFEFGIERFLSTVNSVNQIWRQYTCSSEANFVAQEVEATNACLGVIEVVVLDEAKSGRRQ
jgi:hypothetical protein